MRRLTALGCALVLSTASAALPAEAVADDRPPTDTQTTCLYERYWDPAHCDGMWTISIAEEDAQAAPTPKPHRTYKGTTYRVKRGDTLWRIAVRVYGPGERAGHKWTRIAKANHVHGTKIRVDQRLVIPRR